MKITVDSFTTPLDGTVIARQDKNFGSGGTSVVTVVELKPTGAILSDGVSGTNPSVPGGGSATLGSFSLNLLGAKKLLCIASLNLLAYLSADPLATSTVEIWVGGVKISEQVNPVGRLSSVFTFHAVMNSTPVGPTLVELRISNGPIATDIVKYTFTAMEFTSI